MPFTRNTLLLSSECTALDVGDRALKMDTFQQLHSASKANTGPLVIKRPRSGYSLFDFPACLSPSWLMLSIWKRVLVVPAVKYYKSSIMLPLARCTRIDAVLEQVSPPLQGECSCVIFPESAKYHDCNASGCLKISALRRNCRQNIVLFVSISHNKAFM